MFVIKYKEMIEILNDDGTKDFKFVGCETVEQKEPSERIENQIDYASEMFEIRVYDTE